MQNGYFKLDKRRDGTYLIVFPPADNGAPADGIEVTKYLDKYNIDYEKSVVYDLVKKATGSDPVDARITTLQVGTIDEEIDVAVLTDAKSAVGRFYPAGTDGRALTKEEIMRQLARQGVKFGIIEANIDEFLSNRQYCTSYVLAQAEEPVEGKDAVITYNFNTDLTRKPKVNEDGSVDFHQLDTVSHIEKDQVLAALQPAVHGKPGTDVMGRPIQPKKVNVKFLKQVKHAHLSPDGLQLISDVNGHVMVIDGAIFVSDTYLVPANVDPSTGDIEYNGNVQVVGNVNTGYKIHATGDIIVDGVVEGAELYADGQIILKRGIQGMGKGILSAGTNIISKFLENCEVTAGGFLQTESIMHSNVTVGSEIIVKGKKGFITGGSVHSGKFIEAKTIGSVMGTNTDLEVGVSPKLANEVKMLQQRHANILADIDHHDKVIANISKKLMNHEQVPADKLQMFQQSAAEKKRLENEDVDVLASIDKINEELDNAEGGYILVDEVIYPGCKVTVSNVTNFIRTETKHGRLIRDGADVRVSAY